MGVSFPPGWCWCCGGGGICHVLSLWHWWSSGLHKPPFLGVSSAASRSGHSLLLAFQRRDWRSECQQRLHVLPAPRPAWGAVDAAQTPAEGARGFGQDHAAQKRQSCLRARRSGSSVDSYAAAATPLMLSLKPCKCPGSQSCPIT